jgi:7,8-dihydropterin-6-yl-methyl-4-(beta-D-ribofuranosyl)aminobenzene 5'-phosphate synthase
MLTDTEIVKRPPLSRGKELPIETLLAEHGLSLLITVLNGGEKHEILFDTGYNSKSVLHNMDQLGIDGKGIEAIVMSHAHMDHTGSLYPIIGALKKSLPLIVHPDIFISPRYLEMKDGNQVLFPSTLVREDLESAGFSIIESKGPTHLAKQTVLVTGEVERTTDFEKGLPNAYLQANGHLEKDLILDDQSLVISLRNKGLVLITGCCHAGLINTIDYVKKLTGIDRVYAIFGGFHLSGPFFEKVIERTVEELKPIDPEVLVPMHCTGWKAMRRLEHEFPNSFIINSVGSKFILS